METLKFFSGDCIQHNPDVVGGMMDLLKAMSQVQEKEGQSHSDSEFSVDHILEDGDMVAAHTSLRNSKTAEGGLRQVHLFRFNNQDKIVEYWDITQSVLPEMPNAKNAF
jgi:predicted SnoaL-like aldol condensation-catalyzing enzyme